MRLVADVCSIILPLFFFNDTATTEIYTLSLHDALPISNRPIRSGATSSLRFALGSTSLYVWSVGVPTYGPNADVVTWFGVLAVGGGSYRITFSSVRSARRPTFALQPLPLKSACT